jgi:hypothetical protein
MKVNILSENAEDRDPVRGPLKAKFYWQEALSPINH